MDCDVLRTLTVLCGHLLLLLVGPCGYRGCPRNQDLAETRAWIVVFGLTILEAAELGGVRPCLSH